MEIKQVENVVKTTKTVFVAVDGTEFDRQDECERYEKSFTGVMRGYLKKIAIKCDSEEAIYMSGSCDNNCFVVVPKTEDDIIKIKQAAVGSGQRPESAEIAMKDVVPGDVVMITFGYDNEWAYIDTLNRVIDRITNGTYEAVKR